jgi:predicted acetyltransferase
MNFKLIKASSEHENVVKNLMQFYYYDFSEYLKYDVEDDGLFPPYPNMEDYWASGIDKFPYIIKNEKKYAGFVLVRRIKTEERNYFSIAEFFILRKYRLQGIGKAVAVEIFNLHRGEWEVYQKESNKPAQLFWNKTIKEYTKGQFSERFDNGRFIQNFENF